jgi:hypothetical protein
VGTRILGLELPRLSGIRLADAAQVLQDRPYKPDFDGEVKGVELCNRRALQFGVLAQWEVGDCAGIEDQIHVRLAANRVNERREFFRLALWTIIAAINSPVEATTSTPS